VKRRVLVVDDDAAMCELVEAGLSKRGLAVQWTTSGEKALEVIETEEFDVIVADLKLAQMSGLTLCEWVAENRPDTPVIVITAFGSMDAAVSAMRVGAYDFINKPVQIETLGFAVARAVKHRDLGHEVSRLRQAHGERSDFADIIGESRPIRQLQDLLTRLEDSTATVLVSGESGAGKELVARCLHRRSDRREKPFVAINCAAMPPALLESELFGHVRGAFTDARQSRDGLFVQADGGTLFLDEIGEMPLEMQPKLLRALQESRVRPVGASKEIEFDTRIIAATNRDLESDVEEGRFREDLYYRVNVIQLHVPPLRSRGRDVLLLAQHFVEDAARRIGKPVTGLYEAAAQKLVDYDWPGNVRELHNCIERAVTLTKFDRIVVEDLPEKIRTYQSQRIVIGGDDPDELIPLDQLERRYIDRVLQAVGGNKSQAARILGLDRRTLYRKLERHERGTTDPS
jgi:DNA-binding NtrC family response regulator